MVSSACDVLLQEPTRFLDYILSDQKLREKIVDQKSFNEVMEKAFQSDPTLANIIATLKRSGESLEICGVNIYNDKSIQDVVNANVQKRQNEIEKRVKQQKPALRGRALQKEVDRRLKISISGQAKKVQQTTRQVTIEQSLKPVNVKEYKRGSATVKNYRKSKYRKLNRQEKILIENAVKRGLTPAETVKMFLESGLPEYRTKTSIKRHYYREKEKIKP